MFCTNSKVTKYNIEKFDSLPGTPITFNAKFSGSSKSHIEDIKKQFGNPNMSRSEMLDALAFGNFEEHVKKSTALMLEGKIPAFKLN